MNEEAVLVADDDLIAGDGELARQQITFPVGRFHHAGDLHRRTRWSVGTGPCRT